MSAAADSGFDTVARDSTPGISKDGVTGAHAGTQSNGQAGEQNGAVPMSPVTPSPRQASATWQRPSQGAGVDSSGPPSTSEPAGRDTCLRWVVNIREWSPWDDEWLFLLDLLPDQDQKEVGHSSRLCEYLLPHVSLIWHIHHALSQH